MFHTSPELFTQKQLSSMCLRSVHKQFEEGWFKMNSAGDFAHMSPGFACIKFSAQRNGAGKAGCTDSV